MIHCDGLLLCNIERERKLAVWNPFLGQFKRIKLSSSYARFDIYGFGYDNVSRDNYKILRFKREKGCEEVEIYEFKSQLWRSVDYSLAYSWCAWRDQAMSMNGNMYWIVERENDNSKTYFIQSFDFSKEVFKETCCIPFINHNDWPPPPRSGLSPRLSGFGGDRLSLLAQQRSGEIQVWVTNNIVTDEVVSWSMYCNVTPDFRILGSHPTYLIHHTDRVKLWFRHTDRGVNLWCSEKDECIYTSVYEIGEGEVKKQVETERYGRYERLDVRENSSAFVPSLVPVSKQEETSEGCSC
ncbi:putative F-box protein [Raphanus sativus]|uniref:F-box protein At1g77650 n=1 Tax=Raphanus sativus TaxID=3726 RepID=A0A9W3DFI8_RAPSA|nr:putative F-box protein At1g77650 [Raphanus sativus]KAJ4908775.1 putative F-box protein [Raphanus sativus]